MVNVSSLQVPSDATGLIRYIKANLLVKDLQVLLRFLGLPSTGLKAVLQERLQERIYELEHIQDTATMQRIRQQLVDMKNPSYSQSSRSPATSYPPYSGHASPHTLSQPHPTPVASIPRNFTVSRYQGLQAPTPTPLDNLKFVFKPSPFYTVVQSLSSIVVAPVAVQTRSTLTTTFAFSEQQVQDFANDSQQYKVLLFCAVYDSNSAFIENDVAFPQQCEIKIGSTVVSANTRGLRNRPGTTRPADLTKYLDTRTTLPQTLSFTYALTKQKFAFVVRLVKSVSVKTLVERLVAKDEHISKQSVIDAMVKAAEDPDIEATASNMPLRCPLSTLRIQVPIRSKACTHNRCVDANSFLELQTQAPTWACPICNKPSPYESLVVDKYIQDILDSTSKDVESVRVDPNGTWSIEAVRAESIADSDDDDGDIVETSSKRIKEIKQTATPDPSRTSSQSREPSAASAPTTGNKRTHAQVIDLTLSDDDEPPRPTKRVNENPPSRPNPASSLYLPSLGNGSAGPSQPTSPFPNENQSQNGLLTGNDGHYRFQLPFRDSPSRNEYYLPSPHSSTNRFFSSSNYNGDLS